MCFFFFLNKLTYWYSPLAMNNGLHVTTRYPVFNWGLLFLMLEDHVSFTIEDCSASWKLPGIVWFRCNIFATNIQHIGRYSCVYEHGCTQYKLNIASWRRYSNMTTLKDVFSATNLSTLTQQKPGKSDTTRLDFAKNVFYTCTRWESLSIIFGIFLELVPI